MKAVTRLLLACTLSVSVAGGLAYFQQMTPYGLKDRGLPVFSQRPKPLSADNIVDRLSPLALYHSIAKVDWKEPVLAVDLWMKPQEANGDQVYDDLLQLTRFGFSGTSNVDQLLVRVLEKDTSGNEGKRLLLTMDARRGRFPGHNDYGNKLTAKALLQSNANLTYTSIWRKRFGS